MYCQAIGDYRFALLIPCYNEAKTIGKVISDFRKYLPELDIYVYDNNSTDGTVDVARAAGAHIGYVFEQGKGNAVRRMFSDIEADIYILVDGDGTYDASSAPKMVQILIESGLDMVVGLRKHTEDDAYRPGHKFGNRMLTWFVCRLFGAKLNDILSGYRVFSRRFVKSFPSLASGFEIEVELTVHALGLRMPVGEVETPYGSRPEGSESKLHTYLDGFRILLTMLNLYEKERPVRFFGIIFVVLILLAIVLGIPLVLTYLETGLVPRLPTATGVVGLIVIAFLSLVCGIVIDSVAHGRKEMKRLAYLAASQSNTSCLSREK